MMGKLVGVGLAGLTQLAIWIISALVLVGIGLAQMNAAGVNISSPGHYRADGRLFFHFFSARIFYLRDDLRADRFDGDDRAGRRTICDVSGRTSGDRILSEFRRDPRSEFEFGVLDFDCAVFRADCDARADFVGNASVLANRAFDFNKRFGNRRTYLAGGACLSRRNVDVRKTRDDSRSLEMDSTGLMKKREFAKEFALFYLTMTLNFIKAGVVD